MTTAISLLALACLLACHGAQDDLYPVDTTPERTPVTKSIEDRIAFIISYNGVSSSFESNGGVSSVVNNTTPDGTLAWDVTLSTPLPQGSCLVMVAPRENRRAAPFTESAFEVSGRPTANNTVRITTNLNPAPDTVVVSAQVILFIMYQP